MDELQNTAHYIEDIFDSKLLDSNGILLAMLKLSTMAPLRPEDFTEKDLRYLVAGYEDLSTADFMNYENSGMVQGTFLSAMCLKYKATNDCNALQKARRTFQGIRKVYEMSQVIEHGFYCKPWGFQTRDETSSDQYIYSMTGMDDYYEFASPEEQAQIREMIVAMASFWLVHHYDWNYYGRPLHWPEGRFIGFMALALKYGGGSRFRDELNRLMEFQAHSDIPPFASTSKVHAYKDEQGRDCLNAYPEACLSTYLSLAPALKLDSTGFIMDILRDSFTSSISAIAEDGTVYERRIKDSKTGEYHEIPPEETRFVPGLIAPLAGLYGPFRKGGMQSTMFSRFAIEYAALDSNSNGREFARHILQAVGTRHLTWFEDPFGIMPDGLRWMTDIFSGDAAANWLWCYWKLKC